MQTLREKDGLSADTSRSESEFDPFGAAHGCNSISAGLGSILLQVQLINSYNCDAHCYWTVSYVHSYNTIFVT